MRGDSFRRQTALAERYAAEHGLSLDRQLRFNDAGVSAFRGLNLGPDGQLGLFVVALQEGIVPQGSYLLVESLDRISRQTPRTALRALESVVEAGAVVVTLVDGRKYDRANLDDTMSLLTSIIIFMRAHEESAMKASRLKAAWSEKRSKAVSKRTPMTRSCPAWLELDVDAGQYREIPERVSVVRRIFDMTLAGIGQGVIAQTLNREGVPPFGRGLHWHRTYVAKLLESPAVQGIFVPHVQTHETGKKVRQALEPIKDYFPRIISHDVIESLSVLRNGAGQPRRGRHAASPLNNIFGGLGRCSLCGGSMTLTNKGEGWMYYVCARAKAGAGCVYRTLRYKEVEQCFLTEWPKILESFPQPTDDAERWKSSLVVLKEHLERIRTASENIVHAVQSSMASSVPTALVDQLAQLEHDRIRCLKLQEDYTSRLQSLERSTLSLRLATLQNALSESPLDKAKVNAVLRQLLTAVHISHEHKVFVLEWQHTSKRTSLRYTDAPGQRILEPVSPGVPVSLTMGFVVPPLPTVPNPPSLLMTLLQSRLEGLQRDDS